MTSVRRAIQCAVLLTPLAGAGCRSAMVDATLRNDTTGDIRLIEVAYPSASFGVQILAPGAEFHYRFKILGTGGLQVTYTDPKQLQHIIKGPELHEGEQGRLGISIGTPDVRWDPLPKPPVS